MARKKNENIEVFKADMKALREALSKAQRSAEKLPIDNGRAYYAEQCSSHLRGAFNEIEEIDGQNGYLDYVESPEKIQKA